MQIACPLKYVKGSMILEKSVMFFSFSKRTNTETLGCKVITQNGHRFLLLVDFLVYTLQQQVRGNFKDCPPNFVMNSNPKPRIFLWIISNFYN